MQFRKHAALAVAALATAGGAVATAAVPAQAAGVAPVPIVTIHVNNHRVLVGTNNTITAGRTIFHVVTANGDHLINAGRLHSGYSLQQFGQDINKSFGGDTKAINRVDRNVVFRGGAEATPRKSGGFSANLPPGKFLFLDQSTFKYAWVNVVGKVTPRQALPAAGRINLYTYGFEPVPTTVPHNGWTMLSNHADQPHFVELQHVKASTTNRQVSRYFRGGGRGQPSWALRESTGSGVLSPGQNAGLHLNLPAGKYLVACYWPDFRTGMPHAFMGMWKLIQLR